MYTCCVFNCLVDIKMINFLHVKTLIVFEGLISLAPTSGQNISQLTVSCNGTTLQVTSAVEVNTGTNVSTVSLVWFISDNANTNENVSQFVYIYPSFIPFSNSYACNHHFTHIAHTSVRQTERQN